METFIPVNLLSGDIFEPEARTFAAYLQEELNQFYTEATVEWVDCPDLTREPFNLSAPGLCGNTALLEVGSLSNLFPFPRIEKVYDFKSFLHATDRYNIDNFIMGAGVHPSSKGQFGELIMNATFSLSAEGIMEVKNRSYTAFLKRFHKKESMQLEVLTDINPKCHLHGNFFISEGKSGQVLEVQAKIRRKDKEFTNVIQHTLQKYYNDESTLVGLGGTFVVNNGIVQQHVMPNIWGTCFSEEEFRESLRCYAISTPLVAIGTIINKSSFPVLLPNTGLQTDLQLTTNHFHSFSLNEARGGHYRTNIEIGNTAEYLGYFCPAKMLYRMDKEEMPIILQI